MAKRAVRSFDIFDTLVSRSVADPTDIFHFVESEGIVDFKERRLHAQQVSNHTWQDIYFHYKRLYLIDDVEIERIKNLELQMEAKFSFLITAVYNQVRDGDILVSDMYLPESALRFILDSVGFKRDVRIFVSPAGKASGRIWPSIKQAYDIEFHVGDNEHSDVRSPRVHGIPSRLYSNSRFSPMEAIFLKNGAPRTASILRQFRLTNPFPSASKEFRLHEVQAVVNLPFLTIMSAFLNKTVRTEGLSRVLFMMRDGCLLWPIFDSLFPDVEIKPFYCSRIAFTERRPSFIDYIKAQYVPGSTLIFDLHGSFKTGRGLFLEVFGLLPRVHIFSGSLGRAAPYPGLTFNLEAGLNLVEALNVDQSGPLITIDEAGNPVRAPNSSASAETGAIFRTIVGRFIEEIRSDFDVVRDELLNLSWDFSWNDVSTLITKAVRGTPELPVADSVDHKSLTQIMNEYRSDKGSSYACAHCYTFIYERLIQDFLHLPKISILEIGLNRDGQDDIPSLRGWQSYLGDKAVLYGVDISSRFNHHHKPEAGVHIIVADQSNPKELILCGTANARGYDIIIDDGSHMSSHQQISLSTLWQFLRPGGVYIVEDLHYQPKSEPVLGTRELLRLWRDKIPASTEYISQAKASHILQEIAVIEFYDSRSMRWGDKVRDALVVIRKKI